VSIDFLEAGPTLKGIHDVNHVPSCFLVKVRKITTVTLFISIRYIIAAMVLSADHSCSEALSSQVQLHPEKQNRITEILISWTRGEYQELVWFH